MFVSLNDEDDLAVTVDLDSAHHDAGLSTAMGRQLADAVQTACHAADGRALGWTQYRAESAPDKPTDPDMPGMWKIGPGEWHGVSRLPETFDAATVANFVARQRAAGHRVSVFTRTFQTLTRVTKWKQVPEPTAIVCHGGGAS
ncbi:hypothetical protein A7R75_28865 [Mycolicibacterium llatzerense]|nr:hypothetical protein [Mycolicibacterium llatzerense]